MFVPVRNASPVPESSRNLVRSKARSSRPPALGQQAVEVLRETGLDLPGRPGTDRVAYLTELAPRGTICAPGQG